MTDAPPALKSCEPDLEVLVGLEPKVFRCHSVILASYSQYIDTMLATPMLERETRSISFPDIEPELWEKVIRFLEPGGYREMTLEDALEVLPIYDQYDFQSGMQMCDHLTSTMLKVFCKSFTMASEETYDLFVATAVMCFQLKLPKSMSHAVLFAIYVFKHPLHTTTVKHMQDLLPLIENEESTLRFIVSTILAKQDCESIEAMREVIQEDLFAQNFLSTLRHITDVVDNSMRLICIQHLTLNSAGSDFVNGEYTDQAMYGEPGARSCSYKKTVDAQWNGRSVNTITLKAWDPFGKRWGISIEGDAYEALLYSWESDFSTLTPPTQGWKQEEGELPLPRLSYHQGRR
jgi:hypothetical protein